MSLGEALRFSGIQPIVAPAQAGAFAGVGRQGVTQAPAFSLWLKFILSACLAGSRRAAATDSRRLQFGLN
jgi:hypothetical protein